MPELRPDRFVRQSRARRGVGAKSSRAGGSGKLKGRTAGKASGSGRTVRPAIAKPAVARGAARKTKPPAQEKPARSKAVAASTNLPPIKAPGGRRSEPSPVRSRIDAPAPPRAAGPTAGGDRLNVAARDARWLHVNWLITNQTLQRVQAAFGHDWHRAKLVVRLLGQSAVDEDTGNAEAVIQSACPDEDVCNWYFQTTGNDRAWRVEIGYESDRGRFFLIGRSKRLQMPTPGRREPIDQKWKSPVRTVFPPADPRQPQLIERLEDDAQTRELLDERMRRPMNDGYLREYGFGALDRNRANQFHFHLDAELVVFGRTNPSAKVTLQGEPVELREDGTFTLRCCLPEGRQILPAVAHTADGIDERTIIIALERNTKVLEPMIFDGQES
jgi:hypothetical protein